MVKWVNCSQSMPEDSETRYIMKMRQVNGTFMVRKCFGQNFWGYIQSRGINPKRLNWMPFTPEEFDLSDDYWTEYSDKKWNELHYVTFDINKDHQLVITCKTKEGKQLVDQWFQKALRQYKHNDGSESFVTALYIDSVIIED